ncbi:MAG: DUF3847 domain-containing protein [Ruthenibacterium sp.]
MTKTKLEKIAGIEEQILQLENQRKLLLQKQKEDDRKARTKRLIERGAILESLISGADAMSNKQVQDILAAALSGKAAAQVATFVPAGGVTAPHEAPRVAEEVEG